MTDIAFLGNTPIERLKALMKRLRGPDGCPWDAVQSFETIAPYTIEEAYEVSDAIERNDMVALKEELGDLLFQVVFHSQMGNELRAFDLDGVCDALTTKMVERHPHVFGTPDHRDAAAQTLAWEEMKAKERAVKGQAGILSDVALALPALMRAEKLQKRAAHVGFDWPDMKGVLDKITEEAVEVAEAAASKDADAIEDEIGDLIFAVTNLSRKLGVDPEAALRRTNRKFTNRFEKIEAYANSEGRDLSDMDLDEMELQWQKAKRVKS